MTSTSHFLINLIGILVLLLIVQILLNRLKQNKIVTEIVLCLSLSATVILCMLFPFYVDGGKIFNLRYIPFVLGCLYGHYITSIWLTFLIIGLRLMYSLTDVWFPCLNLLIFLVIIASFKPYYHNLTLTKKIIFSGVVMLFISIWVFAWEKLFFHVWIPIEVVLSIVFIQTFGLMLIVYIMESNKEKQSLVNKILHMEKVEVVSHLAASISHEVRNPLTTTRGFLQLLSESKAIPEVEKGYLTIAMQELDQAEGIIRNYLTFAKPAPEEIEFLNIKKEIERAINIIVPLANMNTVEVSSQIEDCYIKGNSGLFQQVLVNLMKNSIEAMPDGGTLSIVGTVEKSLAKVIIADNGVGMNELQKTRLGEPYFSTKEIKGTGLGMMVVFRIVESMTGTVTVKSEVGQGTQITLAFPLSSLV
jgi:two-component system sporulation sensor kinase B